MNQSGMQLDMRFGWRPDFEEKHPTTHKEALEIRLTYPTYKNLLRTSVRGSHLFSENINRQRGDKSREINLKNKTDHQNALAQSNYKSNIVYRGYKPQGSIDLHLKYGQKIRLAGEDEESKFYDVNLPQKVKQLAMEENLVKTSPRG